MPKSNQSNLIQDSHFKGKSGNLDEDFAFLEE